MASDIFRACALDDSWTFFFLWRNGSEEKYDLNDASIDGALGVISLTWVAFGFSLYFGKSIRGIIGNPFTYFMFRGVGMSTHPDFSPTIPFVLFSLFQLKFAIITPALISGAFAERVKFSSYLIFMFLFSVFIYAPLSQHGEKV